MLHIEIEKLPSFLMGEVRGREEGRKEGEKRKAYRSEALGFFIFD